MIAKHYAGDDSGVKILMGGILAAFAGQTVDEYAAAAAAFLTTRRTPRSAGGCATAATCR